MSPSIQSEYYKTILTTSSNAMLMSLNKQLSLFPPYPQRLVNLSRVLCKPVDVKMVFLDVATPIGGDAGQTQIRHDYAECEKSKSERKYANKPLRPRNQTFEVK